MIKVEIGVANRGDWANKKNGSDETKGAAERR
jgi:hypothetical protein